MPSRPVQALRILLLCDDVPDTAATISDHIRALTEGSRHRVLRLNPRPFRHLFPVELDHFDAVVLHYSLYALLDSYVPESFRERVARFGGLKVQFLQDDYREVDAFAALIERLGIDVLYTLYPEHQIPEVWGRYPGLKAEVRSTLAGFVPNELVGRPVPALAERRLDVVYRGRSLPYWLGAFGQEKAWIGMRFAEEGLRHGLRCDIGWREEDRVYGEAWIRLLSSSRAVLGTESGSSITDFDGKVQRRTEQYLAENPEASFEEVAEAVLRPYEGSTPIRVISPRMFEAIALRTALVLFPGRYSGILRPWQHYIPLERDFSNLGEVADRLRDLPFLEELVERAHRDVVASGRYSFATFAREFDAAIDTAWGRLPEARRARVGSRGLATQSPAERVRWSGVRGLVATSRLLDPRRPYMPVLQAAIRPLRAASRWVLRIVERLRAEPEPPAVQCRLGVAALCSREGRALLRSVRRERGDLPFGDSLIAATKLAGLAGSRQTGVQLHASDVGGTPSMRLEGSEEVACWLRRGAGMHLVVEQAAPIPVHVHVPPALATRLGKDLAALVESLGSGHRARAEGRV